MKSSRLIAAALLFPAVTFAAAPRTFQELASLVVTLLNDSTSVLIVVGLAIYMYGVSTNILNFGEKGAEKIKAYFFWGVIVLFVMVSIWGILHLLQVTLFGEGQSVSQNAGQPATHDAFQPPLFNE